MALKDLLVHVDHSDRAGVRIDFACALADRHDAHVAGLYVKTPTNVPAYVMAQIPAEAREVHDRSVDELAEKAHALFEERARAAGRYDRAEWRVAKGMADTAISLMARYADLTILGQSDPEESTWDGTVSPDELLLSCGRAILLVPFSYKVNGVGDRVLVAWNGSREASRAVSDAMPILEAARQVTVLCINPGPELGDEPGADITRHLAMHGVAAEAAHLHAKDLDPGEVLLSRAADLSADLIVMGGYGRPRLRELVLGGVTRTILKEMTVPVLMAH